MAKNKNKNSEKKPQLNPKGARNNKQHQELQQVGKKRIENGQSIYDIVKKMQAKDKKQKQEEEGGAEEAKE